MRAIQIDTSEDGQVLREAEVAQPTAGRGELLIRVYAAGVTPTELVWYPTTHTGSGQERRGAIPGHEFSGVVAEIGAGVDGFSVGQEVYGMNDWFAEGATAEYCLAQPSGIAPKPTGLTHEEAATVPIGALTAMQGLFDRAQLQRGQRVLVHGGAGAVGIFAVQFAHLRGAHVVATASSSSIDFVRGLGADEVIDYETMRFEESVHDVDVVFDSVGGDTRELSWAVLKPSGRMVSIAADGEATTDPRVRDAFFIVEPSQPQLIETAGLLAEGRLRTFVGAVVPLGDADRAYSGLARRRDRRGKVVVSIAT